MSSTTVKPVSSKRELKQFIRLPWKIYSNDKNWVPPLIMDMKTILSRQKNPFFLHSEAEYFLVCRNGEPVGRVAAILNRNHNKYHHEKTAFFGFFECIDDLDVARALMEKAEEWARGQGQNVLRGPTNPTMNDTCGMLISGFDSPPVIMMTYNPPYYSTLLETLGYGKAQDLLAFYMLSAKKLGDRVIRIAEIARKRSHVHVRNINMKKYWDEVRLVKEIYNDAWSLNWGFVPMTDEEFIHLAKELKPVIEPELVFIAEIDGEPAAFALTLPDYNEVLIKINGRLFPFGLLKLLYYSRRIVNVRILTLGVKKKFAVNKGIAPLLYKMTYDAGGAWGCKGGEFSWILESNKPMVSAAKIMGAHEYKRYRLYEKEL